MKILAIGDIVGKQGRDILRIEIASLKKKHNVDVVIGNGENAAGGNGLTYQSMQDLYNAGIDVITMGNHTWNKKDILDFIDHEHHLIRPANYPPDTPGKGSTLFRYKDFTVGVINLLGRVYMQPVDCPFRVAEREIERLSKHTKIIVVDMHAEASSEKMAMGRYLDGKVSMVFGTHTHVQTADERIFPKGTAYITDVGMTGPYNGILGVDKEIIINKFITQMPYKFELSYDKENQLNGVIVDIDEKTGKARSIQRILTVTS